MTRRSQGFVPVLLVVMLISLLLTGCIGSSYEISGRVTDSDGNGLGEVKLVISGGTSGYAITSESGHWKTSVSGRVTVTPEAQSGYVFDPPQRSNISRRNRSNLNYQRFNTNIFWYMYPDSGNFTGGITPVAPPSENDTRYNITVENTNQLSEAPDDYDVLVLSDVGSSFDITEFSGRVIVTIDSSVSSLMYWMTGSLQYTTYWDHQTEADLEWINPISGTEMGIYGDARIYDDLDGNEGFTRFDSILQARSTDVGDDVVLYQIDNSSGSWWWLHIGPHFGGFSGDYTRQRVWEVINYTLEAINGFEAVLPLPPTVSITGVQSQSHVGNN